ncbi:MAG: YCF48-related protein [Bacteroidia bacterium]
MKRLIFFISIYSTLSFCLFPKLLAQQDWQWKNPFPQGNTLRGSASPDSSTIIMVGDAGTILKSKDGGNTWQKQESGTEQDLYAISIFGPNCVFAVGTDGTIIRSKDCGQTWDNLDSGRKDTLRGVSVLSNQRIIAVGDTGTVLKSIDGGNSWSYEPAVGFNSNLNDVFFPIGGNGFGGFVGDSSSFSAGPPIYTSADSGITFTPFGGGAPTLTGKSLNSLWIPKGDPNKAVFVGQKGVILNTFDGGFNWLSPQSSTVKAIKGITFFDDQNGFAYGAEGLLLRTRDCGSTWSIVPSPEQRDLLTMSFPKDSTGLFGGGLGLILRTPDGGASFEPIQTGFSDDLTDITFLDDSFGIAVGRFGTILRTTNGGEEWAKIPPVTFDPIESVTAFGGKMWLAGGVFGSFGRIYQSSDSGQSWFPQPVFAQRKIFDIHFADSLKGYAVGLAGAIYQSFDGGSIWTPQTPITNKWLLDVTSTKDGSTYIVGGEGSIFKSTDLGTNWSPLSSGTQEWLTSVSFLDDSTGMACGNHGVILRTKDAGQNWEDVSPPNIAFDFTQISMFQGLKTANKTDEDSIGVTAVGYGGTIMYSPDFGDSWYLQKRITNHPLTSCFFNDSAVGLAVGHYGTILKTDSVGEFNTTGLAPDLEEWKQYKFLQQNFPNPFQITTTIPFEVPYHAPVDMRIYNNNGHLISQLIKEERVPGTYQEKWDSAGLPDGIYYCRLQIGAYSETRKMLKE